MLWRTISAALKTSRASGEADSPAAARITDAKVFLLWNDKFTAASVSPLATDKDHGISVKDGIALIRDLFFIAAILLFFLGWLFAYFYLNYFGIPIHMLEAPIWNFYFYSINVITYAVSRMPSWAWALVAASAVGVTAALMWWPPLARFLRHNLLAILLIAIVAVFVLGFDVTRSSAHYAAQHIRNGEAAAIQFDFVDDGSLSNADPRTANGVLECPTDGPVHIHRICTAHLESRFFPIVATKTSYIVFYKADPPEGVNVEPRGFVYQIPISEVATAVTLPNPPRRINPPDSGAGR